jgi:protein-tyrosine phosphatase
MIDIHCHILPGLDDGAKDMVEALQMADIAIHDGITALIATPHAYPDVYFAGSAEVEQATAVLREQLKQRGLPLQIAVGRDAHLYPELCRDLKEGRVQTLNGSRYVLIEPSEYFILKDLQDQLFRLRQEGFIPVITHPERYQIFLQNPELADNLAGQGNLLQVTAGSLTSRFGHDSQAFCRRLAEKRLLHVVASDAHSPRHRVPTLQKAYRKLEEWIGPEDTAAVRENPLRIWEDRDLIPLREPPPKRGLLQRLKRRFRRPPAG